MSITACLAKFLMEISTLVLLRPSCLSNGVSGHPRCCGNTILYRVLGKKKITVLGDENSWVLPIC